MKVVMTLLVRDERDILGEHLDYHLANGVDTVILMDNLSTDGTAEIARAYQRAGRLHYLFQPQDDYAQGTWVTEMARLAADVYGADWVINSDADEFWYSHAGTIKDALRAIDDELVSVSAERTNFVARRTGVEPFWRRMDVRYIDSRNALGQPLPGKVAHRGRADIVVEQGNHRVGIDGGPVPSVPAGMTILHYPVRSRAQFRNKIVKGGAAYARNADLDPAIGGTWRALYRQHLAGELDAVYDREAFTEERIASGLLDGTLVRDERLIDALGAVRS